MFTEELVLLVGASCRSRKKGCCRCLSKEWGKQHGSMCRGSPHGCFILLFPHGTVDGVGDSGGSTLQKLRNTRSLIIRSP